MPPENGLRYNVYLCDAEGKPVGPITEFDALDTTGTYGYDLGNPLMDMTIEMTFDVRNSTITYRSMKRLQYGWRARGPVRKRAVTKAWREYSEYLEALLWTM